MGYPKPIGSMSDDEIKEWVRSQPSGDIWSFFSATTPDRIAELAKKLDMPPDDVSELRRRAIAIPPVIR